MKSIPKTCNPSMVLLTLLQVTTNLFGRRQKVQDWNSCRIMGWHWNLRLPCVLSQEWGAEVTAQPWGSHCSPMTSHAKLLDLWRISLTVKERSRFSCSRIFYSSVGNKRCLTCIRRSVFLFQLQPLLTIQKCLMPGFFPFFSRFFFHC